MNFLSRSLQTLFLLSLASFLLTGCIKDSAKQTFKFTYYTPVYQSKAEVHANVKSNAPRAVVRPGKIYVRGNYIFLNEVDRGVHVIDNSNPAQPRNMAFIDIPGNLDVAVNGNTLYADLYTDMVAVDITNPAQARLQKVVPRVFPNRNYGYYFRADSTRYIIDWIKHDSTATENTDLVKFQDGGFVFAVMTANMSTGASVSPVGYGGSMARFALAGQRLYSVSNDALTSYNIDQPSNPVATATRYLSWNAETIYPFQGKLFIGTSSGMFIYDISNPDNPTRTGQFAHVNACDPVVADNVNAYVTLRSGTTCDGFNNQLDVLSLNGSSNPSLVRSYPLSNPHGLGKDGDLLFICDAAGGLKIYDARQPADLRLLQVIRDIAPTDIILMNGKAIVTASQGLYQYAYSASGGMQLLSRISTGR